MSSVFSDCMLNFVYRFKFYQLPIRLICLKWNWRLAHLKATSNSQLNTKYCHSWICLRILTSVASNKSSLAASELSHEMKNGIGNWQRSASLRKSTWHNSGHCKVWEDNRDMWHPGYKTHYDDKTPRFPRHYRIM